MRKSFLIALLAATATSINQYGDFDYGDEYDWETENNEDDEGAFEWSEADL